MATVGSTVVLGDVDCAGDDMGEIEDCAGVVGVEKIVPASLVVAAVAVIEEDV